MIKAIIEEHRRDAFISCIEPAMNDFIQREVIERFCKEEKTTLFLAYGNFPGKERFFDLLYQALSVELKALAIPNVKSCQEIYDYMTHYVDASPENYHNKIIWFQIKSWDGYEAPLDTANFSPLYGENSYILRALQSLSDRTIGVVVTYGCASTAMFTSHYDWFQFDYDWDTLFRIDRLWKIYTSSVCYTSMIADDIRNEMEGTEIKTVEEYYRKFQKKVLAYANHVLKRKRKREAKEYRCGRIQE